MLESLALSKAKRDRLNEQAVAYQSQLDTEGIEYLQARGVTEEACSSHRLGRVTHPLPGDEEFEGRISIPYLTKAGVVAIKFRDITGESGIKYHAPEGQKSRLYNARALDEFPETIVICERELDAVIMHSVVGIPAVGAAGVSVWKEHMHRCSADSPRIIICTDNDEHLEQKDHEGNPVNRGQQLAKKIHAELPDAEIIKPPKGDVNEWLQAEGAEAIRERLGFAEEIPF